jgi:hypothetical protein
VVDIDPLTGAYTGELDDGTPVPLEVLRRWACDTSLARVLLQGRTTPVDLGTAVYTPSAAQRRALLARDRRCTIPGCRRRGRWCEAHHVVAWPHGPTNLSNLVLLCARHHKLVHAEVLRLVPDGDRWQALGPHGTPLRERPPPPTFTR